MKRLFYVLPLVAVLAIATTAAASPTITGSASLTVSGSTSKLSPSVGDLSFNWDNSFSVGDGTNWSLSGKLAIPQSASLTPTTGETTVLALFPVAEVDESETETPEYHYYVTELGWEVREVTPGTWDVGTWDNTKQPPVWTSAPNWETIYFVDGKPAKVSAWVDREYLTGVTLNHNGNVTALQLYSWKLMVKPSIFQVYVANGASLTTYATDSGWLSLSANPGGNHLQVSAPVGPFTVVYDKANSGSTVTQEGLYVKAPQNDVFPATFQAVYKANEQKVALTANRSWGNGYKLVIGGGMKQGATDGLAYGAELTVPISSALEAYGVAKQVGSGWDASQNGKAYQPTLLRLTYKQPQYKVVAYLWQQFQDGSIVKTDRYAYLSLLLNSADAGKYDWYWDANYDGAFTEYRQLKGVGVYAKAPFTGSALNLMVASPVLGKGSAYANVDNLLAKTPKVNGELFVPVTDKLTSTTTADYTVGSGLGQISNKFNYTVSGSSSVGLTLTKPANDQRVDYTATFTVSF